MKLILIGLVIIFILFLIFLLRPRNTAFHRNVRPRTVKILMFVLFVVLVGALIWFAFTAKKEGVGPLKSDRGVVNDTPAVSAADGEILEIIISTDYIRIGKKKYTSVHETKEILRKAAKEGKTFLLTDDYAPAELYLGVRELLLELGVSPEDIEEYREP